MKKMRRFAAIAAAAAMTACMAVPMMSMMSASAATITITDDGTNASASTFKGYKLLTASDGGKDANGVTKFAYEVNSKYREILITATGATGENDTKVNEAIITAIKGYNAEDMREFADEVYKAIKGANLGYDAESSSGVITTDVQGYYLIAETALADGDTDGTMSLVMVDTLGLENVTVKTKKEAPTFQKKLKDTNDTTGVTTEWQDSADYDIGDTIPFQLTATLPDDYANYKEYNLTFHDCLQDGKLSYNAGSAKVSWKGNTATEITPTTENLCDATSAKGDDCDLEFTVDVKTAYPDAQAGDTIVIEYTANLTAQAVIGSAGNWNAAYLEYSNNPYYDSEVDTDEETTSKTVEDMVVVFTYKTVVNKVDPDGNKLTGAEFTLEKEIKGADGADPTWKAIDVVKAEEGKVFTFTGLDDGNYRLTETVAPAGYNKLTAPIIFTVSAAHEVEADVPTLTTLTGDKVSGELDKFTISKDDGSLTADVVNQSGTELPSTGGIGTTLFYVIGGTLAAGAGVSLIAKKRMKNEE